ncbi:MAG: calcium-transporting P-type ATPase, PMR1-type [Candidatus Hydrothermarchaeota archaeon]
METRVYKGLNEEEARRRLEKLGYNEIEEKKRIKPSLIFLRQFKDPLIVLLLISALISVLINNIHDALAISVAVLLVCTLGFSQEYRSEKSIQDLKEIVIPEAKVIREGRRKKIPVREVVVGDIILIETGDKIPADARILDSAVLEVDESILTGESVPVSKSTGDTVYMGTIVTYGRALGEVISTGKNTELGKIAEAIQIEEEKTPLQIKLAELGKQISIIAVLVSILVFIIGVFQGMDKLLMFTAAISLAVAAIPEGLPVATTITLALGVNRMAKHNAIVRRLPSVETLGSASIICTDKTGTLTKNEMSVKQIYTNDIIEVGETLTKKGKIINPKEDRHLSLLLKVATLCNNAELDEFNGEINVIGSSIEGALLVLANKFNIKKDELEKVYKRINVLEFDSLRKRMSTIHKYNERELVCTKGAPEAILDLCSYIFTDEGIVELTADKKREIQEIHTKMARKGMHVLAFSYKDITAGEELESEMVFLGFVGMHDPPREEAKESIKKFKETGAKIIMLTGDSKETAITIAKELGILNDGTVISFSDEIDLDKLENIENIEVCARVFPEHKVDIVKALKKKGYIVGMTGDGVNDAPALKMADIGIAMGKTGTDVAKEASDIILTDDNFATIVRAIEEGKSIYNNIKNFLLFQLSTSIGAISTILGGMISGNLILNPIQILWINVVMDGPPAQSLGVEPADPDIIKRPPRDPKEKIISRELLKDMILMALIMSLGTLGIFYMEISSGAPLKKAQTLAFSTFVMFQIFNALNCRSRDKSFFRLGALSNKYLLVSIVVVILMQFAAVYLPPLQEIFGTISIGVTDWVEILIVSSLIFLFFEFKKTLSL